MSRLNRGVASSVFDEYVDGDDNNLIDEKFEEFLSDIFIDVNSELAVFLFHYHFDMSARNKLTRNEYFFGLRKFSCNSSSTTFSTELFAVDYPSVTLYAFTYFNSGDDADLISCLDMLTLVNVLDELPNIPLHWTKKFIKYLIRENDEEKLKKNFFKYMLFRDHTHDANVSSPFFSDHQEIHRAENSKAFREFWEKGWFIIMFDRKRVLVC